MKKPTKQKVSNYQKALDRMERETQRAISHVQSLHDLYVQCKKKKEK